jgi:steroid 5-alpha reductase family enzyme
MIPIIVIIFGYFLVFFIVATIIKNNSIVDIGWGFGFVLTAWILFFLNKEYTMSKIIVNFIVSLWGLRLFYHILKRNLFEEEDFRYAAWRKAWGKYVIPRAFLQVFMLQGLFMFIVGIGVFLFNTGKYELHFVSYVGIVVFLIGYLFEVIGDYQLKKHIADPSKKGVLLTTGLWKYTRHPNYFGEAVIWWGIFITVFAAGLPWYVIISPIVITYLLRFVSGVPMLEKKMKHATGWDEYAKVTNAFIPWFPKKVSSNEEN